MKQVGEDQNKCLCFIHAKNIPFILQDEAF